MDALRSFESDLALIFHLTPETDIQRMHELVQPLCVVMHRDHPLAAQPGAISLRQCLDYPVVLPSRESAGRQLLDTYLARRSIKLRALVESNSFEFLLGYLRYEQALSFQIQIGVPQAGDELVSREIADRGFPAANLVLASLQNRQLPVVAYAFAEYLMDATD
ncbi:MAG: LysR substrate-binding domain-containing protein [Pseudomonadota bacterium]|nr:LysR substrate-binding domain-containing protein [Pseudomonadota bacterium]